MFDSWDLNVCYKQRVLFRGVLLELALGYLYLLWWTRQGSGVMEYPPGEQGVQGPSPEDFKKYIVFKKCFKPF